ncbi:endonuclease domain-containing protein [Hyphobacterium sp.]|jgi:very-short-patch-repair endonuclease|uniref:endonuclease domain-containing protein n=1 Tax=Hyphobacterium sp. TaxID=2004662 RepID=UPI003BA8F795
MRQSEGKSRRFAKRLRQRMTNAETMLWSRLRRGCLQGFKFRRQHPVGPYIADFACIELRMIVEIDGATHATPRELAYDARRTRFLESMGWFVYRATNPDIYENLDGVLDGIAALLPPPPLRGPPPP